MAGIQQGRTISLRPVRAGEGQSLRALRLRALRDAPRAFASSFEREATHPHSLWAALAKDSARAVEQVVFVAVDRERWLGMACSRWFDRPSGIAQLWGMWVEPAVRGRGLARALVDEVAGWAVSRGAVSLRLGVMDRAAETADFYVRLDFTRTGESRWRSPDGSETAFFLARSLRS